MTETVHAEVPLPGMPPAPVYREFSDDEIRRYACENAEAGIHEAAESKYLWESLPGPREEIRQEDVDRLRAAMLRVADEVRDRG